MAAIYCCDVGSVKAGAFGWVRATRVEGDLRIEGNEAIDDLIFYLREDLTRGSRLALGFEAPLFMPVPDTSRALSCGRDGERDRSCFAPTGGYVTALGMHELLFVLDALRTASALFTLDWEAWRRATDGSVLIWEAFVSGKAHSPTGNHCQDAATATIAFLNSLESGFQTVVEVKPPRKAFSLAGAALLWAGLADDLELLHQPVLVIKPRSPYSGRLGRIAGG